MIPKTCRMTSWDGPLPEPGEFLISNGRSEYAILAIHINTRPEPKSIARYDLGKLERGETIPPGATVHYFEWNARG